MVIVIRIDYEKIAPEDLHTFLEVNVSNQMMPGYST